MEDRVCLTSENHPNLMIAMCGTFFNGITFAPLNPAYTESKVDRFSSIIFHPIILFGLDVFQILTLRRQKLRSIKSINF